MITYGKNARDGVKLLNVYEIKGLSTDEKPTDVGNGSLFLEMDTAQVFFFDGESGMWINVGTIGGGGSDDSGLRTQIAELKGYLADVAAAISDKGGVVPADYADYDTAIEELPSGGGVQAVELLENGFLEQHGVIRSDVLSATKIHNGAFAHNVGITNASFPNCLSIGSGAFNATFIASVDFPECLYIGRNAFESAYSIPSVRFPKCEQIDDAAFRGCEKLTSADFPKCTKIGDWAFHSCSKLADVKLPLCQEIGMNAFYSCYSLPMVRLDSCKNINLSAFAKCYRLVSLYLLGSSIASVAMSITFTSTPIAGYTTSTGGVAGSIFVRASLLDQWKQATNWAYFSSRFVGLTDEEIANL